MEEHFPHSMAKAVMDAAKERGLTHEEMHSKVEYIVAHGISTQWSTDDKAIIGSHHFVFEDEKCNDSGEIKKNCFRDLPPEYSHLYLANRRRTGSGNLYRRSSSSRSTGSNEGAERSRIFTDRHDDRRQ